MRRIPRIALIAAGSLAALLVLLIVAALIAIQTSWFRNMVRERIVQEVETATGGRAEIGSFSFAWTRLQAEVRNFVIHGTEAPNERPFVRAALLQVRLKVVSVFKRDVDIAYLGIHQPQVYIRVARDGSTNIPTRRVKRQPSGKDPIETILDLAIRRFEITNGWMQYASRRTPLDVRGENLRAQLDYDLVKPRYAGAITITPVYVRASGPRPLPVKTSIALQIERGRIEITSATFDTPASRVMLTAALKDLATPSGTLRLNAKVSPAELAATLGAEDRFDTRRAPPFYIALAGGIDGDRVDVVGLQASLGGSHFEASGALTDVNTVTGSFDFSGNLAVGELGRLLRVASRPEGAVALRGRAKLDGPERYLVTGGLNGRGLSFQAGQRRITAASISTDVSADPRLIALSSLRLAALGRSFAGGGELRDLERFRLAGRLKGLELRTLARQYAARELVWDGAVSGTLEASGSLRSPVERGIVARVNLAIAPGRNGVPLAGRLNLAYDGPREAVDLGASYIELPATRLDLSGSIGSRLQIRLASRDLNDLLPAIALGSDNPPRTLPLTLSGGGQARFDGSVTGRLSDPRIAGHVALSNFAVREQKFDRLVADVSAASTGVSVKNAVLARGRLAARADASVGLRNWKPEQEQPLSASATVRNARIEELLALAGQKLPLKGELGAEARVTGTIGDPRAAAQVAVLKGAAYDEPFERFQARLNYTSRAVELSALEFELAAGRLDASAVFQHPQGRFDSGQITFRAASSGIALEKLRTVQTRKPGLSGTLDLKADGQAAIDTRPNQPRILFSKLDAALNARSIEADKKQLGNLTATATTKGKELLFELQSDLAESKIRGQGAWVLDGDFPIQAVVTFVPVRIGAIRRLAGGQGGEIDGVVEGEVRIAGPTTKLEAMRGSLRLARIELSAPEGVALQNRGPVAATLDRSTLRIEQARFAGKSTDIAVGGALYLNRKNALDLRVDGKLGLNLLEQLSPGVYASGAVLLNAAIEGRFSQPLLKGKLELRDAAVNMADAPNGISKANGVILFSGSQAVIQSLTAESGGGKISLTGYYRFASRPSDFRLQATAKEVRVRYPAGTSTKVNAAIDLSGTERDSVLGGSVTILETAFHSQTDFGSMLSKGAEPPQAPEAKTGLLGGMRLNVRVDTAPGAQFQTTLAQNLQAEAHVELRGTPPRPGMLGRVAVTQGEIIFFGSKYQINRATVSFFNPQKVEPVLDVDLQTRARGVDVFLSVTGPVDKMNLAYRSDPPLQFSDIVALLATGKAPTSDPVLAVREPPAPEQNLQQMGASAVLSQAVANPVAGRLQRLFGVTKLKIDPQITGAENNPQARMTLEQQITKDLSFTYITDLTQSNPQVVRVEWAFDPAWSAIAVRQENGQFGLDFYYRKRFK